MRWISAAILAMVAACGAAPPTPHFAFVMPQPSLQPRPAPGDTASPVVYVMGEIQAPGRVRLQAGLTLIGAIVDSGGLTALAARRVRVMRTTGGRRTWRFVSIDAIIDGREPDLPLVDGDQLFIEGRYV